MENLRERSPCFSSARPRLVDLNRCQIKIASRLTYFFSLVSPIYVPALQPDTFSKILYFIPFPLLLLSLAEFLKQSKRGFHARGELRQLANDSPGIYRHRTKGKRNRKKKAERALLEGYSTKRKRRRLFDKD